MGISKDRKISLKKRIIYYLCDRWLRGDVYFYDHYGPISVRGGHNGQ